MRKTVEGFIRTSWFPLLLIVAVACGKDKTPTSTAMSADLKRDPDKLHRLIGVG